MKKQPFTELRTGWMAPNGDFYPTAYMEHLSVAGELYEMITKQPSSSQAMPDAYLGLWGWCGIYLLTYMEHGYLFYYVNHLTPEQKRVIKPVFEKSKNSILKRSIQDLEDELYEN